MARVCVIRCHYYRDTRVQREVGALLDRGHTVSVLCLRGDGEPIRERRDRLIINRIPLRHRAGASGFARLLEYAMFFVAAAVAVTVLHMRRPFDLVQVNSVPDALVFAALVPRLTGAKVLLDLQEPFPEFFAAKSGVSESHWVVRLISTLERASIRFADAAVTVTESMRETFVGRGAPEDKVTVVMDGSDERTFDRKGLPPHSRRPDRFVLVSHGTIEPHYGLDTAIHAVAELVETIPAIQLRIVGDGSQRSELIELAARLGVSDHVSFSSGFVPIDELVATIADADVGIVAMKRSPFRDLTLAGKMFDFITMGVPMAVSMTRSVEAAFPAGCFESFVADDPRDLARAVARLHASEHLAASYAARAREVARPYSWQAQRERYQRVVDTLLVGASARQSSPRPVTGVAAALHGVG